MSEEMHMCRCCGQRIENRIDEIIDQLRQGNSTLLSIDATLQQLVAAVGERITGIVVQPGVPVPHKHGERKMTTVKLVKKNQARKTARKHRAGDTVADFVLFDNQDDTCTVMGTDAAGDLIDISSVASLTPPPTSSDPTALSVDPPAGMTFAMHAVVAVPTPKPPAGTVIGHSDVTTTATWNDGSIGPFSFTLPVDLQVAPPGAVTGIVIVPGTPTVH